MPDHSSKSSQVWGSVRFPQSVSTQDKGESQARSNRKKSSSNNLVRSTRDLQEFTLAASDGEIGHVDDFIIDDETWTIRYLVVDTRNWWPGKKVMLSPAWIRAVDWRKHRLKVELSRKEIRNSPEYDDSSIIDRDYEERLYQHYGQTGYWAG